MELTRREFLKASGAGMGAFAVLQGVGSDSRPRAIPLRKEVLGETPTICCYCSVGCGALVSADKSKNLVMNMEGDPDHPISQGTLCTKGQALSQIHN
ncbi:MAG: twin-arginine translocation signal domain-containing protein, partial [Dehalococcoidia bacterium]|nr:twin-arginine translocation signal domain-containing protein [Dehalococcoidia bacterium]